MIDDKKLEESFLFWLGKYKTNGYRHTQVTTEERLIELYYDDIVDRVLEELPEMTDSENDEIIERLNKMF